MSPIAQQTVKKGVTKDKQKNLHTVAFEDKVTSGSLKYIGVCAGNQLCHKIVYDSVTENIAPKLLRAHQEDVFSVSLQEHKIGIIVRNQEQQPMWLL